MAGESDTFLTVAGRGEATIVVRGSEFVARAGPATSVDAAEAFVEAARADHPNATHNVPAYRVRADGLLREHYSDEGEPTGTAGKPALTVLRRREVENVALVVTRYFGGTELGVGGLARAYADAAGRAVDDAGVVESRPQRRLTVTVEYGDSGTVRGVFESEGVEFEADYGERVRLATTVPAPEANRVRDRIMSATGGRARIEADD